MNLRAVSIIDDPGVYLASALSGTSVEAAVLGHTISGQSLGTFKSIGFRAVFQVTTGVVPPALTIKLKFGSSTLVVANALMLAASLSAKTFVVEASITNQANMSTQAAWGEIRQPSAGVFSLISPDNTESSADGWAVDTTQDQVAQLTAQFSSSQASASLRMLSGVMRFG